MKAILVLTLLMSWGCQKYSVSICDESNRLSLPGLDHAEYVDDGDTFKIVATAGVGFYEAQFIRKDGLKRETWPMSLCQIQSKIVAEFSVDDGLGHRHYSAMLLKHAAQKFELRPLTLADKNASKVGPFRVENHGLSSPDEVWTVLDPIIINEGNNEGPHAQEVLNYLVPLIDEDTQKEAVIVLSPRA